MIVVLPTQHGSVGKATPAPSFANQSARQGKRIAQIDADPQAPWSIGSEQSTLSSVRPPRRRNTGALRCITIVAFPRSVSVPDMRREPPAREFPDTNGERS
jgi:hypothetical protein